MTRSFLILIPLTRIRVIFSFDDKRLGKILSFRFKRLLSLKRSSRPVELPAVPSVKGNWTETFVELLLLSSGRQPIALFVCTLF